MLDIMIIVPASSASSASSCSSGLGHHGGSQGRGRFLGFHFFQSWEIPQHTSSATWEDLLGRYDGGDGTLSRAELEKMKAHEDFMLLSAVGMRHNIDSALEPWNNRFWLAWFDFVPDILNLLNAINNEVTFPANRCS